MVVAALLPSLPPTQGAKEGHRLLHRPMVQHGAGAKDNDIIKQLHGSTWREEKGGSGG